MSLTSPPGFSGNVMCLLCCESITSLPASLPSSSLPLGTCLPCSHDNICGNCHLRLRYLHKDFKCPQCKVENERVVVGGTGCVYEDFAVWGDDLGAEFFWHEESRMFWPKAYFHAVISSLFSLRCNVLLKSAQLHGTSNSTTCPYAPPAIEDRNTTLARRNNNPGERGGRLQEELDIDEYSQKKPPREIKPLLEHMKEKHSQTFCVLCYVHKRSYLSSLTRYGVKELEGHLREEGEVTGHAKCEFCNVWMYDLEKLHKHLNRKHYKCHVCESQKKPNQFFKDYKSVERHFGREHWACGKEECKRQKFVVFGSEIDYRSHMRDVHGVRGEAKINVGFKVLSAGYDGSGQPVRPESYINSEGDYPSLEGGGVGVGDDTAFVPASLMREIQDGEEEISDPVHRERTRKMRERAAELREQRQLVEDYPSLGGADSGGTGFGGWGGGNGGASSAAPKKKTMEEEFPTLGGSSKNKKIGNRTKKLTNNSLSTLAGAAMDDFLNVPFKGKSATMNAITGSTNIKTTIKNTPSSSDWGGTKNQPQQPTQQSWVQPSTAEKMKTSPPNLVDDFPTLGISSSKKTKIPTARKPAHTSNILNVPKPSTQATVTGVNSAHRVQLDVLKSHLSKENYKTLKKLTKDFANDRITAEVYVNNSSGLFGGDGKGFKEFMPSLISGLPGGEKVEEAKIYIESVGMVMERVGRVGVEEEEEIKAAGWIKTAKKGGGGGAPPPSPYAVQSRSVPQHAPAVRYVPPPAPVTTSSFSYSVRGVGGNGTKKKGAWGAAAVPGVKAAGKAVNVPKQVTGTATKAMAELKKKERKERQKEQESSQGGGKKKKNQQKKDLQSMIFG